MNPFFNNEEFRPRALIRIVLFLFISLFALAVSGISSNDVIEYIFRSGIIGGLFYFFIRFVDQRGFKDVGLSINTLWIKEFIIGTTTTGLIMSGIFLTQLISGDIEIIGVGWESISNTSWFLPVIVFFIQMLSVGFYEEVVFRGYIIPNLKEGLTLFKVRPSQATIAAVILSSGVFGFAHLGNPNATIFATLNIVLAGVMLSIPLILTGRLALSIGLHFGWNFFQGGIFGFRVSGQSIRHSVIQIKQGGNELWTGGSFGPEGGAIGVMGVLFLIAVILVYVWKKNENFSFYGDYRNSFLEKKESLTKADELT